MLNKKRTPRLGKLRLLLVLPLTGAMLSASTLAFTKDYGYFDLLPEKGKTIGPFQEKQKTSSKKPVAKQQIPTPKLDLSRVPSAVYNTRTGTYSYFPNFYKDKSSGKSLPFEPRYILINGTPIADNSKFYGVTNATNIEIVKSDLAIKKYGKVAAYGAVIITGNNVKIAKTAPIAPPPVEPPMPRKTGQGAYDPTLIQKQKTSDVNHETQVNSLLILDGKTVTKSSDKFALLQSTDSVKIIYPPLSVELYGEAAKHGALVMSSKTNENGTNTQAYKPENGAKIDFKTGNGKFVTFARNGDETFDLSIYNRWGELVYSQSDYRNNWDGIVGNDDRKLTDRVFYYTLNIKKGRTISEVIKGYLSISR